MKHHLLKSVILSLILVMGVSNAWAKRYYFEVPEHWDQGKVYKLRLYTGENNPNGWSRALQKLEGTTNTYYYDNSGYTHVQFCQMKDGKENEIYISNTQYNTTRTAFPQTDENLLKVTTSGEENTKDQYIQYEVAPWDYQIFTAENVHFLFNGFTGGVGRWEHPKLLIGTRDNYSIYNLPRLENTYYTDPLCHHFIAELNHIGYTIINAPDEEEGTYAKSFLEKIAGLDQQAIQRTKIYYEPLVGNVFHRSTDGIETKIHLNDITDLNSILTVRCEVSYDGGNTYVSTGTLPVDITSETKYFGEDWNSIDQIGKIELKKGSNTFQTSTRLGFATLLLMTASNYDTDLYELVGWKNLGGEDDYNGKINRYYHLPNLTEQVDFVFRLKRIEPNKPCTVRFEHPNSNVTTQQVAPNTRATKPTIEATNPGHICKWYSDGSQQNEFDFDTHVIEDITLYGTWVPEAEEGDYRLLYVEQVVEKSIANGDEWKTIITRKKAHPSDIIKPSDLTDGEEIVSLHVYNKNTYQAVKNPKATKDEDKYYTSRSNSAVILQRYNGTTWEDKEHHMVFGPMETLPAMAMLPGRRNTGGNAILKYDDGIPVIQTDEKYNGNGVWNFPIVQSGNGDATLDREHIERYEGTYYIRTANADGGWNNYTIQANHMTRSEYQASLGLGNEEFTHYFCKWVDLDKLDSKYVHYVVANKYAQAVSDTLIADRTDLFGKPLEANQQIVGNDAVLPTSANIRFSWREENNALHRAYLAPSVSERFLVVQGNNTKPISTKDGQNTNEEIFHDISNWVYHADVQMQPGADIQVTAKYNEITQYFIGDQDEFRNTVLQGTGEQKYLVRLLYDFKNNELISAYVPGGNNEIEPIQTNLMLIRTEDYKNSQEEKHLAQLGFTTNHMQDENQRAYGVLEITKNRLTSTLPYSARTLYWVSFPFDVRVSDVFSSAVYGKHWIIQSYNGAKRAAEGLYLDSDSNWEYHFDPNTINANNGDLTDDGILKKGVGYVVALNYVNIQKDPTLANADVIGLYFPSTTPISNHIVNNASITIDVPAHSCNINKREVADSHWNVIGVPAYKNAGINFENEVETLAEITYYYKWLGERNSYQAVSGKTQDFNPLHSYMVQYHGNLNWTSIVNEGPASLTAKRNTEDTKKHQLRLELQQNAQEQDRTFIQLQDEEATAHFDFNYDLCKIKNTGANIYSIITTESTPIQVAGNVMPIQETVIPVGVVISAAGEYTFAMPEGTDGIVVELIDYETNTRTNMLLDNYTVNLGKGSFENRFALHVKPDKTTTSVDNIGNEATGDKVKKYLIDGVLYMQKDGVLYDAQGKLVR